MYFVIYTAEAKVTGAYLMRKQILFFFGSGFNAVSCSGIDFKGAISSGVRTVGMWDIYCGSHDGIRNRSMAMRDLHQWGIFLASAEDMRCTKNAVTWICYHAPVCQDGDRINFGKLDEKEWSNSSFTRCFVVHQPSAQTALPFSLVLSLPLSPQPPGCNHAQMKK